MERAKRKRSFLKQEMRASLEVVHCTNEPTYRRRSSPMTVRSTISFTASEPFTRSYFSPTMITRLFLSRCLDWHQVCPGRISSFSHRNQTAFSPSILFVIDQHSFNARATPYSILIRSIRPCSSNDLPEWAQFLPSISLIHCNSPGQASTSLPIIIQFLSPCSLCKISPISDHVPTLTTSCRFVSRRISKKSL